MLSYIKEYYLLGLYKDTDLDVFVNAKWITAENKTNIMTSKSAS